jgi:hypothetical protein
MVRFLIMNSSPFTNNDEPEPDYRTELSMKSIARMVAGCMQKAQGGNAVGA